MNWRTFPPLLTRTAAAKMTGLSPRYMDRLRHAGAVRTYETIGGGKHLFYRDELLNYLKLLTNEEPHGNNRQAGARGHA